MRGDLKKNQDAANPNTLNEDGTPVVRVRLPNKWNKEQFALAELMMGANHIRVRCVDGVTLPGQDQGDHEETDMDTGRRYTHCDSMELPGYKV